MRTSPWVKFNTVTLEGKLIHKQDGACFGGIWHKKFGDWGVEYFPNIRCPTTDALKFLHDMKEVGFDIPDPAEVVTKGRYFISSKESPLGSPVARGWFFGNLTLVRYVDEFTSVINEYLLLRDILPEANKFHLLQLAHCTKLSKEDGTSYGMGHCLVDHSLAYVPERYRSWEGVVARFQNQETGVQSMFSGRFGRGEGLPNVHDALRTPTGVKRIHEVAANAKT